MAKHKIVSISFTIHVFECLSNKIWPRRDQLEGAIEGAATIRFLVTGETYTLLHYQFRTGKATI